MGPIKPLHSLAKHKGGEKAAERRCGLCVCACVKECACARAHLSVECWDRGPRTVPG